MKPLACLHIIFLLAAFCFGGASALAKDISAANVATQLDGLKGVIAKETTAILRTNTFKTSYTTVWRSFEDNAIEALCAVLSKHISELREENFDRGKTGQERNRLADLAILCGAEQIEVSVKAARRSAIAFHIDIGT